MTTPLTKSSLQALCSKQRSNDDLLVGFVTEQATLRHHYKLAKPQDYSFYEDPPIPTAGSKPRRGQNTEKLDSHRRTDPAALCQPNPAFTTVLKHQSKRCYKQTAKKTPVRDTTAHHDSPLDMTDQEDERPVRYEKRARYQMRRDPLTVRDDIEYQASKNVKEIPKTKLSSAKTKRKVDKGKRKGLADSAVAEDARNQKGRLTVI